MNIPTKEELRTLSQINREVAVSIFMPTHEARPETRENPIRFKNRLQEAGTLLSERGYDDKDINSLLDSAQALVGEADFWQHQRKGLALFISQGESFHYRLPVAPEALTLVSDRFHLKPLMPLLTGDGRFYILNEPERRAPPRGNPLQRQRGSSTGRSHQHGRGPAL